MPYRFLILLFSLFYHISTQAQKGYQHHISSQNITSISQDKSGFLWIGTNHGLNRFDGYNYIHFFSGEGSSKLPNDNISSITTDSQGRIWASQECGLCYYIPQDKTFHHTEITNFVLYNKVQELNTTHMLAQNRNQVIAINKESFKEDYHYQIAGIYSYLLTSLPQLHQIWVTSATPQQNSTIYILNQKLEELSTFTLPQKIHNLQTDLQGHCWITSDNGLLCLDSKSHELLSNSLTQLCEGKKVLFLHTNQKIMAVGIQNEGLFWYDPTTQSISQAASWQKLTGSKYISFLDRDYNIWLTTGTEKPKCYSYHKNYENIDLSNLGLSSSYIYTIKADKNGLLWMRSSSDFVGYNPATQKKTYHQTGSFGVFIIDEKQQIWLINQNTQVLCYEIQDSKLKLLRSYQSDDYISSICEDPNGNIFIATQNKLAQLLDNGDIKWISAPKGVEIMVLYEAEPTRELIATTSNQVFYKVDNGKFSIIDLPAKSPCFFYHERGKGYVIASNNEGVIFYDNQSGKTDKYSTKDNLAENHVKTILRDDEGNWWLGGPSSISRMTKDGGNITQIHDANYSGRFMYAGSCKAPDGTLYYAGGNGLTVIHPKEFNAKEEKKPIIPLHLDLLEVNSEILYANPAQNYVFNYNENTLTFWYTALQLALGEHINYAYKLEGKDKDWIICGNTHRANYSNLPAGDYVFKVRVRLENGKWSSEELCQPFTINPAPWATWWAKLIYLIIFASLTYICWRIFLNWEVQKKMLQIAHERIQELVRNTTSTTLQELDHNMVEEKTEPILKEMDRKFMEELYAILDKHLDNNDFSVQQLAQDLHLSYSTTYNRIKALTGETPQHFLTTYRMNRAMELLKSKQYNVSEVSYMVGASSLANFSKAFKKKFGISPTQAMTE